MPDWGAIEGGDDEEFRLPSVWDEAEQEAQENGPAEPVVGGPLRGMWKEKGAGRRGEGALPAVPYPFGNLEAAARAVSALDERLADRGAWKRWSAALRRSQAADHGRLCGFPVDVADACLVEFDPLSAGQSRLNGMWVVARGLKAAGLVQKKAGGLPPDAAAACVVGEAALGRWGAEEAEGAAEVCGEWRSLSEGGERGLLVFARALSLIRGWPGLDVEERAVVMGVMAPWLGRAFVPTRRCSVYLMRELAWAPALWESSARSGGARWVAMCLEGVGACALRGHNVLRQLELRYGLALKASPARRKSHSYRKGVDLLFECPLVDVGSVMRALGLSRAGAQRLIGDLVGAGVLRMSSRGRGRRYDAWQIGDVGG